LATSLVNLAKVSFIKDIGTQIPLYSLEEFTEKTKADGYEGGCRYTHSEKYGPAGTVCWAVRRFSKI
jgi:hypothetical protein